MIYKTFKIVCVTKTKKTIVFLFLFLFAFILKAQSHYEFYKPVDTINDILNKNPNVFYVEKGEIIKNIKQIQANKNGKIKIIDTIYTEIDSSAITSTPPKVAFIDLFQFDTIIISGSHIFFKNKYNETYRTIYGFNNKDIFIFKKQIEILKTACLKNSAIDYIKKYYFDFKTGYDSPGGYFTITDNYKVKIVNSIFSLTFDTYDKKVFIKTETVSFDLKEVLSVYNNGTETLTYESGFVIQPISDIIGFKTKTKDYNLNIKYQKRIHAQQTEIFKAFEELIKINQ